MSHFIVGVDVGGTNVKLGVVAQGRVAARTAFATAPFARKPADLIGAIAAGVLDLVSRTGQDRRRLMGVGIGLPGLVDVSRGIVRLLPNIPGWHNIPLRRLLSARLRCPVLLDNDVNMITLGEWTRGAGRGCRDILCLTLGTGVGAGLVLDGKLYRGPGFAAGEIGHAPLNERGPACGCGGWGCFERYVGNARLRWDAARLLRVRGISLEEASRRAVAGNRDALAFWDAVGVRVANGLVGPVNILNPQRVIVGGGVSRSFPLMRAAMLRTLRQRCMKTQAGMVRLVRARLGDDAGIIGAEALVHDGQK